MTIIHDITSATPIQTTVGSHPASADAEHGVSVGRSGMGTLLMANVRAA
ncbi:MAG: hypothetical protein Q4G37_02515 [Bifidobacterium sp.]|nr:hypothetical protein [Bifidobacterium sp.]